MSTAWEAGGGGQELSHSPIVSPETDGWDVQSEALPSTGLKVHEAMKRVRHLVERWWGVKPPQDDTRQFPVKKKTRRETKDYFQFIPQFCALTCTHGFFSVPKRVNWLDQTAAGGCGRMSYLKEWMTENTWVGKYLCVCVCTWSRVSSLQATPAQGIFPAMQRMLLLNN